MGINGLLPLLKSIHKVCNLKKFEGQTLAVDAYGWLHRGTVSCAMELATGKPTKKFVDFAMHRVRMLQHFGVTPFLIFDGDYLPSKAKTEDERSKRRAESKKAGLELLGAGKPSQAYLEFQKAVDVTPELARQLIDELRKAGVQYIVAPYEADAQMVYLERKGIVDGIISEDSDLLVFGAKCLLTKLDQYGNCIEVNKADFSACKEITLTGWSDKEFRQMAILSGCDYLASINNMGLKTAYRMVRKHKTIEKVVKMLQFDGKFHVPKNYLEAFYQAELTFLHQRVFCPQALALVLHTQPERPVDEDKMSYIGAYVEPGIARGVARGDLNPMTKLPIAGSRSQSAAPATPWTPRTQLQRSKSSDVKKSKPLDNFFKPKRTPLAELDPNCFTPSPNQQDALRRNQGPWLANSIQMPRPYLNRADTEPQLPQSAPPPARTQSARHNRAPTVSEPRPPKRARLCEDEIVCPGRKADLIPSKFFASNVPEPSPTATKSFRSKRSKKQNIFIHSDDSTEEAMLNLPDVDTVGINLPKKKVSVFREENSVAAADEKSPICSVNQETSASAASQETDPRLTTSMRSASPFDQPPTPTEISPEPETRECLRSRFAFNATPSHTPTQNRPMQNLTPSSVPQIQSKIPVAVKSSAPAPKAAPLATSRLLTPLQRLGAATVNRPKLPMKPPLTPSWAVKPRYPRRSLLGKDFVPFPEVASETTKSADPAMIPLPNPDETENVALNGSGGSEDLIIHDSEGDDEPLSPFPGEGTVSLDLGRFRFSAQVQGSVERESF